MKWNKYIQNRIQHAILTISIQRKYLKSIFKILLGYHKFSLRFKIQNDFEVFAINIPCLLFVRIVQLCAGERQSERNHFEN